ncbi:MAG: septal ring lytic transglycosylase RlpA family protein [Candidatus Melainabacteria bacterium]|nr:septal ring lytic transglycosylase RlpA family protein [Candidatus Melainabacteria bacterium]
MIQYKNLERVFLYLLPIVVFYSSILLDPMARASTKSEAGNEYDSSFLRGEIWYGNASWYGPRFQGKKTSSGEKYNKNRLTAAHPYLPFNTMVLVTNLKNKKSVVVRINDRGPFIDNRIIDLSEEAAEKIDSRKEGIAYIKLQVLNPLVENQGNEEKEINNES